VKLGLPWKLPKVLVKDLVAYVVSRRNICRTTALSENVSPRVLFTGAPVDYKKELQVAFGDYVEEYEGMDDTSRARSSALTGKENEHEKDGDIRPHSSGHECDGGRIEGGGRKPGSR
jgi:hypothetical protein